MKELAISAAVAAVLALGAVTGVWPGRLERAPVASAEAQTVAGEDPGAAAYRLAAGGEPTAPPVSGNWALPDGLFTARAPDPAPAARGAGVELASFVQDRHDQPAVADTAPRALADAPEPQKPAPQPDGAANAPVIPSLGDAASNGQAPHAADSPANDGAAD